MEAKAESLQLSINRYRDSAHDKTQVLTLIIHKARPKEHPKAPPPNSANDRI